MSLCVESVLGVVGKSKSKGGSILLISTLVSPLANLRKDTSSIFLPRRSHMESANCGCEEPAKTQVCRMLKVQGVVDEGEWAWT